MIDRLEFGSYLGGRPSSILLFLRQVTSALTVALPEVEWPVSFSSILDVFKSFSLDFFNQWGKIECSVNANYCQKTLFVMCTFGIFAICMPCWGALLRKYILRPRLGWSNRRLEVLSDRQIRLTLVIFTIVHAPLTMRLLKNLNCEAYGPNKVVLVCPRARCDRSLYLLRLLTLTRRTVAPPTPPLGPTEYFVPISAQPTPHSCLHILRTFGCNAPYCFISQVWGCLRCWSMTRDSVATRPLSLPVF